MTAPKVCKDCAAEPLAVKMKRRSERPAPYPGPRCRTHHYEEKRARRLRAANYRTETRFGLTPEKYDALKEAQGGKCALCRRATGATKRLAVDHDHACCIGPTSCGRCVRGLVCGPCNDVLAHARDNPEFFVRGALYLEVWPSQRAGLTEGRSGIRRTERDRV